MAFETKYTLDQKMQACNYYTVFEQSSIKTSKRTGIPAQTIRGWTKQDWWYEMVVEIRKRHQARMDGRFSSLIDTLTDTLVDRITKGDEVLWAKTGKMLKRQISAKDAGVLLNMIIEKRALLRGDPTSRTSTMSVEKQMQSIQEKLEKRTIKRRKAIEDSDNIELMRKENA